MMHSFEVEGIEKKGEELSGVVVGKILEIKKHPNADRLKLTKIDIGNKKLDIVCGASNIKVGNKVPVALAGAKLPSRVLIKETEIRGVKSFGMLCAEDELGLGKSHEGILILEDKATIGEEITKALGLNDTVFEIKILPDRGHDSLSHVGVAREVAVLENKKFSYKTGKLALPAGSPDKQQLTVRIEDKNLCPRYIGALISSVKVQESPSWMKNRLQAIGVKPINNIVDATNYVMMELGQPLHAFDFNKVGNGKSVNIIVRKAKNREEIKLLDETVKKLSVEDLVIANEKKSLAIAGVMGGEDSGINENTASIVLEAANFNAVSIRRTRTRLNIRTEASDRFEKEIDPNLAEIAMARVIEIIESFGGIPPHQCDPGDIKNRKKSASYWCGGKLEEIVDAYPKPVKEWKIKLDLEYVNKLLGEKIPEKQAIRILNLLELETSGQGKTITVKIPTIRIDLKTQEDLIEEIGRIYGYEKIKATAPLSEVQPAKINERRQFERMLKDYLVGAGFSEVYNYSFYSQNDAASAELLNIKHLELQNPMNPDQALMRVSLIPGMLKNIKENLKYFKEIEIFEVGRTYIPNGEILPQEKNMLVGAVVLDEKKKGNNFYEIKGHVDLMLQKLGVGNYYFDEFRNSGENISSLWHKTRCAEIEIEGSEEILGYVGEISPLVLQKFGIEKRVAMFEIDLEKLRKTAEGEREFKPLRKFPVSERDISMIASEGTMVDEILQVIQEAGGNLVIDTDLFDIYDLSENETSFAFRIFFASDNRTLRNEEVDEAMKKIINKLEKELEVKVRK